MLRGTTTRTFFVAVTLALLTMSTAQAGTSFWDPLGYYELFVTPYWVFQVGESSNQLVVFYGQGTDDLLYIERVGRVQDESVRAFAERSLTHYKSPHGPQNFEVTNPLHARNVGGTEAVYVEYRYETTNRQYRQETRVFVILDELGFTITYSDSSANHDVGVRRFWDILDGWRWLIP